jgi:hypothetical protein
MNTLFHGVALACVIAAATATSAAVKGTCTNDIDCERLGGALKLPISAHEPIPFLV